MNLLQLIDCWRADDEFCGIFILLLQKKRENLFEYYFSNVFVNINFLSDLKFEYHCQCYPEILL